MNFTRSQPSWKIRTAESRELAKKLLEKSAEKQRLKNLAQSANTAKTAIKRPSTTVPVTSTEPKKIKGILKNRSAEKPPEFLPTVPSVSSTRETISKHNSAREAVPIDVDEEMPIHSNIKELPEGFFDDPEMDAKARNVKYKDPKEEEWEKFQKEIKEETHHSMQLQEEDQEEASHERQIEQIDEQYHRWSRILNLEIKKENLQEMVAHSGSQGRSKNEDDDSSYGSEEEFEEFLDWRTKSAFS